MSTNFSPTRNSGAPKAEKVAEIHTYVLSAVFMLSKGLSSCSYD